MNALEKPQRENWKNGGRVLSMRQLKELDLLIFCIFAVLAQTLSTLLLRSMHAGFYFSLSLVIAIIAMIRWGAAGALVYAAAGIPAALFSGMAVPTAIAYHIAANLFTGIPALVYGKRDRDRIAADRLRLALYVLACHVSLSVGKGLAILCITGEVSGSVDFFGSILLTLIINLLLCELLKGAGDLLCDMRNYVVRVNKHDEK